MEITLEQLVAISPYTKSRASVFLPFLNAAMQEFQINTPLRAAAFLAQILHESGSLVYTEEIASGAAYEGRKDLGNTISGYGKLYKGRGLIQLTGYFNYVQAMVVLDIDCVQHPELLSLPENACRSAAWFFSDRGLNSLADKSDFLAVSIKVNGKNKATGLPNGWKERQALYLKCREVLKC